MFFLKNKNIFYIIITAFLLICLFSTVTSYATYSFDEENILSLQVSQLERNFIIEDYARTEEEGRVVYRRESDSAHITVPLSGEAFNFVEISADVREGDELLVRIFYPDDNGYISELTSAIALVNEQDGIITASLPNKAHPFLRLDVYGSFSPSVISLKTANASIKHGISAVALVLSLVSVALLIIFERKIGYFSNIKQIVKSFLEYLVLCRQEKRYAALIIRVSLGVCLGVLILSSLAFLGFFSVYGGEKLFVFLLGAMCSALFLADSFISKRPVGVALFILIMLMGFVMVFTLPTATFNSWDENIHYERAVQLRAMLFNNEVTHTDFIMQHRVYATEDFFKPTEQLYAELLYSDVKIDYEKPAVNVYNYIAYLPAAFTMFFMDMLDANFVYMYVMARLANILTYALLIFFGIKGMKSGGLIFASVALFPTSLFLAASFSTDYFITACMIFFFGYIISVLQSEDRKIGWRDILILLTVFVLGCGPKAVYFPLALPGMFIPKTKFTAEKTAKAYRLLSLGAMLVVLLSFVLPFLFDVEGSSDYRGGEGVSALGQVKFILEDIPRYIRILVTFLAEYVSLPTAAKYVGDLCYIGYATEIFGSISIILMLTCALLDKSDSDLLMGGVAIKLSGFAGALAALVLVASSLYVAFTPVGSETVLGCQYRYIIPILVPVMYLVGSGRIKNTVDKDLFNTLMTSSLAAMIFITYGWQIFLRLVWG